MTFRSRFQDLPQSIREVLARERHPFSSPGRSPDITYEIRSEHQTFPKRSDVFSQDENRSFPSNIRIEINKHADDSEEGRGFKDKLFSTGSPSLSSYTSYKGQSSEKGSKIGGPSATYGAPLPTYGAPAPTYGVPAPTYGVPASTSIHRPSYRSEDIYTNDGSTEFFQRSEENIDPSPEDHLTISSHNPFRPSYSFADKKPGFVKSSQTSEETQSWSPKSRVTINRYVPLKHESHSTKSKESNFGTIFHLNDDSAEGFKKSKEIRYRLPQNQVTIHRYVSGHDQHSRVEHHLKDSGITFRAKDRSSELPQTSEENIHSSREKHVTIHRYSHPHPLTSKEINTGTRSYVDHKPIQLSKHSEEHVTTNRYISPQELLSFKDRKPDFGRNIHTNVGSIRLTPKSEEVVRSFVKDYVSNHPKHFSHSESKESNHDTRFRPQVKLPGLTGKSEETLHSSREQHVTINRYIPAHDSHSKSNEKLNFGTNLNISNKPKKLYKESKETSLEDRVVINHYISADDLQKLNKALNPNLDMNSREKSLGESNDFLRSYFQNFLSNSRYVPVQNSNKEKNPDLGVHFQNRSKDSDEDNTSIYLPPLEKIYFNPIITTDDSISEFQKYHQREDYVSRSHERVDLDFINNTETSVDINAMDGPISVDEIEEQTKTSKMLVPSSDNEKMKPLNKKVASIPITPTPSSLRSIAELVSEKENETSLRSHFKVTPIETSNNGNALSSLSPSVPLSQMNSEAIFAVPENHMLDAEVEAVEDEKNANEKLGKQLIQSSPPLDAINSLANVRLINPFQIARDNMSALITTQINSTNINRIFLATVSKSDAENLGFEIRITNFTLDGFPSTGALKSSGSLNETTKSINGKSNQPTPNAEELNQIKNTTGMLSNMETEAEQFSLDKPLRSAFFEKLVNLKEEEVKQLSNFKLNKNNTHMETKGELKQLSNSQLDEKDTHIERRGKKKDFSKLKLDENNLKMETKTENLSGKNNEQTQVELANLTKKIGLLNQDTLPEVKLSSITNGDEIINRSSTRIFSNPKLKDVIFIVPKLNNKSKNQQRGDIKKEKNETMLIEQSKDLKKETKLMSGFITNPKNKDLVITTEENKLANEKKIQARPRSFRVPKAVQQLQEGQKLSKIAQIRLRNGTNQIQNSKRNRQQFKRTQQIGQINKKNGEHTSSFRIPIDRELEQLRNIPGIRERAKVSPESGLSQRVTQSDSFILKSGELQVERNENWHNESGWNIKIPETSFSCRDFPEDGYYADVETACKVSFHNI